MKSKILSLFLLTAIFAVVMVSAADFSVTQPSDLSKSINETSFRITNLINETVTVTVPLFSGIDDDDGHMVLINQDVSGNVDISSGESKTVTLTTALESGDDFEDLALGSYSDSVEIVNTNDANQTATVAVEFVSSYCEVGSLKEEIDDGERELEIVSVKDKSSDDDWEWKPLDQVEVDVKVKFRSDDNDDDIDAIIEVGLYDTDDKEFVDLDNEDDLERDISLDEGESITETFIIEVPVEDVEDSSGRYKLYVKVYEDGDEDVLCRDYFDNDYYQDIKIDKNSYDVVLDQIDLTTPVPCGEEVEVTARVYNIGTHDEDRVKVTLFNRDLGIDLESDTFDLDEGDSRKISFTFMVPEDADEKSYTFTMNTFYRYRESTETYREESDNYDAILKVEGNCQVEEMMDSQITAELDPETPDAIAGEQVIIRATVRNTGDVQTTYTMSVTGNSEWSSLNSIDPQTVTLQPGESRNVNIYLNVDEDAEGDKEFTIRSAYEGGETEQKVALAVISSGEIAGNEIATHLRNNWFIYVIAVINIILIIAIIVVVRSMVGRHPAPR